MATHSGTSEAGSCEFEAPTAQDLSTFVPSREAQAPASSNAHPVAHASVAMTAQSGNLPPSHLHVRSCDDDLEDELEEEYSRARNHVDPRLPAYDGESDPELWLRHADVLFKAHNVASAQQGLWLVAALRGAAARYWHFKCAQ